MHPVSRHDLLPKNNRILTATFHHEVQGLFWQGLAITIKFDDIFGSYPLISGFFHGRNMLRKLAARVEAGLVVARERAVRNGRKTITLRP